MGAWWVETVHESALPLAVLEVVGSSLLGGGVFFVGCSSCMEEIVLKLLHCVGDNLKLSVVKAMLSRTLVSPRLTVNVVVVIVVLPIINRSLFHVEVRERVGNLEGVADLPAVPPLILWMVFKAPSRVVANVMTVNAQLRNSCGKPWGSRGARHMSHQTSARVRGGGLIGQHNRWDRQSR